MVQETAENRQVFLDKVRDSLGHVEKQTAQLRALYTRLIVFGALSSAGTTLVTGITAAKGPIVGEGTEGWRVSCIIAAILSFAATLCIGLNQQLGIADRLSAANNSLGRLKYLDVTIATGDSEWNEITQEYQDIIRHYPDAMR